MKVEFKNGRMDGDVDPELEGFVYLQLDVVVDGEREGNLTGYYKPEVIAHIKSLLGVNS